MMIWVNLIYCFLGCLLGCFALLIKPFMVHFSTASNWIEGWEEGKGVILDSFYARILTTFTRRTYFLLFLTMFLFRKFTNHVFHLITFHWRITRLFLSLSRVTTHNRNLNFTVLISTQIYFTSFNCITLNITSFPFNRKRPLIAVRFFWNVTSEPNFNDIQKELKMYLWRTDLESAFLAFISAPFWTNNSTICKFPFTVATYSGVSLFVLSAFMSAPFPRHTCAVFRSFVPAARWRTVLLSTFRSSTSALISSFTEVAESKNVDNDNDDDWRKQSMIVIQISSKATAPKHSTKPSCIVHTYCI